MLYWLLLPSVFANIIDEGFTNLPGQITKNEGSHCSAGTA